MKKIVFLLIAFCVSTYSFVQNELELYKRIYKTADSLKATGQPVIIDTSSIFKRAQQLDKKHPSGFFESSGDYLTKSKFNEAAFLYYLGLMRFRYFNSANPNYQPSGDGALLGSLRQVMGEPINMYLRNDIDNFLSVLKLAVTYYSKNDFTFYSKSKNIDKFNAQIKSYNDLILEIESNKLKYSEQWAAERVTMEENIDRAIEEQKKQDLEKGNKGKTKRKK